MPHFFALGRLRGSVAILALFGVVNLGVSAAAQAADRKISSETASVDCSSLKPGDTLTLAAGTRGPLAVKQCNGTASNPIIIRNDPDGSGPTVIRRSSGSSGGFIFNCFHCVGVKMDGSYKWRGAPSSKTYGIKITMTGGQAPSAFLRFGGLSRFVTIRNVEVDGAWPAIANYGTGIQVGDIAVKRSQYPSLWREGILIDDNFVHHVAREGMYIGHTYKTAGLPVRNVEVRNNRLEDIGYEGINTKSAWEGDNSIHHNRILRSGKNSAMSSKDSQYSGITNLSGKMKIYNNWIETTGKHGIQAYTQEGPRVSEGRGPFEVQIFNNVIVDAGGLWKSFMMRSNGINVGAQDGCEEPIPRIYSNTVVNSRQGGINVDNNIDEGVVRDNIVAGTGSNPAIATSRSVEQVNNRVGSVSEMEFADSARRDFHLRTSSPARNEGTNDYPSKDFDDKTRPKEGAADQGAFESN